MKKTPMINPESQNVTELQQMIRHLLAREETWENEIKQLMEQLRLAYARHYGKKSESFNAAQGELFNEAEVAVDEATSDVDAEPEMETVTYTRKARGKRKPLPENLPRERNVIDLPEDEKVCACCDHPLHPIGEDKSEKLKFTPAVFTVIETVRPKYACRHCETKGEGSKIVQQPAPASIIPKSIATESLLSHIILGKFQYALPLYRQEAMFKQAGIHLPRTTMARWMVQVAEKLMPLYFAIKEHLVAQKVIAADETPLNVLENDKKSYMWVYCSGADSLKDQLEGVKHIVLYDYSPGRSAQAAKDFLGKYNGYLQTDAYAAYESLTRVTNVACMAHARRYFMDAKKVQTKGKVGKADIALAKIQKLYALEIQFKGKPADEKYQLRQEKAKPLLDELHRWLGEQQVIGSTTLGKAISYMQNHWVKLRRYIDDGHLNIDNNRAERAIKPFVIGRKNWLFNATASGAKASAILYSLIETAKANDLHTHFYLERCMEEMAKPNPDIESILPWNYQQ